MKHPARALRFRTFAAHDVYGVSVLTAVTAQNIFGVIA